ncbi:hypothetical protein IJD44_10670 [bacterium]|nr:hypothetical protein [bacterium]
MRKLFILLSILCFTTAQSAFSNTVPTNLPVKPPSIASDFTQTYKTSSENLLYLLLSAINEHNYSIEEIQFKTGSVLFRAYSKEFLASVCTKDGYSSFIKIVPADNKYNFSPLLIEKLQNYIESNTDTIFQKVL